MKDYISPKLILVLGGLFIGSCGLQSSMYVNYAEEEEAANTETTGTDGGGDTDGGETTGDTDGGETTGDTDGGTADGGSSEDRCAAALTAFSTNVAPNISGCAVGPCHGSNTPIAGANLVDGDDETNRTVLLGFDSSDDGSTLFNYITGAHGGGNQGSILPQSALTAWKTAELDCTEN